LQELSQQVVADPEYIEAVAKYGADPLILSSAEWNILLLQESEKVFSLTKSMGLIKSDLVR
jgi:tripartite-type tricarboxylate transporter receptor subunit TctC